MKHLRQMYWYGECLCRWKHLFILEQIIWWTWKSTRKRTSRKFKDYLIAHRNYYWSIPKKFWMWNRLSSSPCMDEISIVSWSSDQVDKRKSACLFRLCSVCGTDGWKQWSTNKMGRSSGRTQGVSFWQRIHRNRCRTSWIRVQYFPRIYIIADSSTDSEEFAEAEHQTWWSYRPDHLHVNVQRHWLDKKMKWWNLCFDFRKSQGTREKILARTLDVPRSWRWKEVVWNSSLYTWRKMRFYSHSNGGTIQRYRSSSIQEYQCFFWVVELCKRRLAETPHTSMRMLETQRSCSESFILKISSASTEQFRIGVNTSVWWRKKRNKKDLLEGKNPWAKVYYQVWILKK